MYSLVSTDTQWCGIHETDSSTSAYQYRFDEYGQRKQDFLFQFNKTVVGYFPGKQMCQVFTHIFQIEMFEASVSTGME